MSEAIRCSACGRLFNAKMPKCPFCGAVPTLATPSQASSLRPAGTGATVDVAGLAAQAFVMARPILPLEYHPATVVALDLFFDETWGTAGEAPDAEEWVAPPGKLNVILHFGAFFGELLRRELGGRYLPHPAAPDSVLNTHLQFPNGLEVFPFARVFKRMQNGSGDALEPLYVQIRQRVPAPPTLPPVEGWKRFAHHFEAVGRPDLAVRFYDRALQLDLSPSERTALAARRVAAVSTAFIAKPDAVPPPEPRRASPAPSPAVPPPPSPLQQALSDRQRRIDELLAHGAHETALARCEALLALSPAYPQALVAKGRALLALGRAQQALDWLEDFPFGGEAEPSHSLLRAAAADRLGEKVKVESAIRMALGSKKLSPEERALCQARADALSTEPEVLRARIESLPDLDEAIAAYGELTVSHPDDLEAWCERGVGLSMKGRLDEALACFDRAAALKPDHPTSYDHQAVALMKLQRFDEALAALDAGLRHCPTSGRLHCRRGICETLAGNAAAAVRDFERSLEVDPGHLDAWAYKGDAESKSGRTREAIASLERYLALCRNPRGKVAVAVRRQLFALKNPGRQPDPEGGQGLQEAAFVAARMGERDVALLRFDEAVAADPLSPELWFNRGACLMTLSRLEEALASYQRAEALAGPDAMVAEGLVPCLLRLGRNDDALAFHDRALAFSARLSPGTLLAKARTLRRIGRPVEALPLYERLVRKNPTDVALVAERAEVLAEAGQLEPARFAFDAALELAPGDANLLTARARLASASPPMT